MDEEELNLWYEEEKQKIEKIFVEELSKERDHKPAEQRYTDKLNLLIKKYNVLMIKQMEKEKKIKDFKKKIEDKKKELKEKGLAMKELLKNKIMSLKND